MMPTVIHAKKQAKALDELTKSVCRFLLELDAEMKLPSTPERGKRVAALTNSLEMVNDNAMHFDLNLTWKQIANRKKKPHKLEGK